MNRFLAFLTQPNPKAKLWHFVWLAAVCMFYGSWVQAVDTATHLGGSLSLRSHIILLTPVWLLLVAFVATQVEWRQSNQLVQA